MNRRAKHHPHSQTNTSRQTQRLNATRIREKACRRCDHESFHAKLCAKRKKLVVENAFETQLRKHMQNQTQVKPALIKRRTVVVRVERPGSGIVVCHVRLLVDTFDVYRQLATQVRSKLNEPYGPGRQHRPSRPWEACDFELFTGYKCASKCASWHFATFRSSCVAREVPCGLTSKSGTATKFGLCATSVP